MAPYDPYANYRIIMNGNMISEDICIPRKVIVLVMTVLFPPLGVFYAQLMSGFKEPGKIFISLILTMFFYFPGLIYSLKNNRIDYETDE